MCPSEGITLFLLYILGILSYKATVWTLIFRTLQRKHIVHNIAIICYLFQDAILAFSCLTYVHVHLMSWRVVVSIWPRIYENNWMKYCNDSIRPRQLSCNDIVTWSGYYIQYYSDVIMSAMASQSTSVYSSANSGTYQRKHQSSASLAFVRGIHRWPVNSPHKGPVTWKMFPFDDVIMSNKNTIATRFEWLSCKSFVKWISDVISWNIGWKACPQGTFWYLT